MISPKYVKLNFGKEPDANVVKSYASKINFFLPLLKIFFVRDIKKDWIAFVLITSMLLIWKFLFHELWKDEWQAWLVARDQNIIQTLSFLNYEGHPSLWYLFLKPFTLFSGIFKEDLLIKIAHCIPVLLTLYILFIKFSSHFIIKILSSFSYFFFFEYGIVCRAYVLVILFTLLTVYFIKSDKKTFQAASIFLLCQSEVYGVMIGFILLFYQYLSTKNLTEIKQPILAYGVGALVFIVSVYPRGNDDDFSRAYNKDKINITLIKESFQGNLANTFGIGLIDDTSTTGTTGIGTVLSVLILLLTIYLFKDDKTLQWTWVFGCFAFFLFGVLIYTGGVRQWGMLFVLFIGLIELYNIHIKTRITTTLVILLLIAPVFHNARALYYEYRLPFTNARTVGKFIKDKIPENVPIVALNKFETANAAAYAERKFYEMPSGTHFSYFKWLEKVYLPTQAELILFAKYKKVRGIVIISSKPIDEERFPFLKLWETFNTENIKKENFYLYALNLEQLGSN